MPSTIIQRVADGDAAAVDECLGKYSAFVWSLARRLCVRHEDVEDAVQQCFVDIWRNATKFDPGIASEATYITMIARRRLIDQYRRRMKDQWQVIKRELLERLADCAAFGLTRELQVELGPLS